MSIIASWLFRHRLRADGGRGARLSIIDDLRPAPVSLNGLQVSQDYGDALVRFSGGYVGQADGQGRALYEISSDETRVADQWCTLIIKHTLTVLHNLNRTLLFASIVAKHVLNMCKRILNNVPKRQISANLLKLNMFRHKHA